MNTHPLDKVAFGNFPPNFKSHAMLIDSVTSFNEFEICGLGLRIPHGMVNYFVLV